MPASLGCADALVGAATSDSKYVITSPNADYVPEAFVGLVEIVLRKDYRYGPHDPILWPQIFTEGFEYLSAVRRRVGTDETSDCLSRLPDPENDFRLIEGSAFKTLGTISRQWMSALDAVVDIIGDDEMEHCRNFPANRAVLHSLTSPMREARARILYFPSTFRDACLQVREVQRFAILSRAYLDYARLLSLAPVFSVHTEYMGAFTTDPAVVQKLFYAGVPVWFIRPDVSLLSDARIVRAVVMPDRPSHIETQPWQSGVRPIYSGLVGVGHLAITCRPSMRYLDISHAPLLVRYDTETYQQDVRDPPRITPSLQLQRRPAPCKLLCLSLR